MINQKLEELKEKLGVTKYTYVDTLEDPDCCGPICYFVDDKSILPVPTNKKHKKYCFNFKRRYDVPLEEDVPSEYGAMCFYYYPEEKDRIYYYYPSSKKYVVDTPEGGMVGLIYIPSRKNKVNILIGHVLNKIKKSNFL